MKKLIAILFCLLWIVYLKGEAQLVIGHGEVRDHFVAERLVWSTMRVDIREKTTKRNFIIPATSIKFIEEIKE